MPEKCGLKKCRNPLGPGAAEIGFHNSLNILDTVRVCSDHAFQIMMTPRGSYLITDQKELKPIPAKRIIT